MQSNFTEIILRLGCSPVNLLHIFKASFLKNTSGGLLLSSIYFANDPQIKVYPKINHGQGTKKMFSNFTFGVQCQCSLHLISTLHSVSPTYDSLQEQTPL